MLNKKLRLVFVPYLWILTAFLVGYTCLNWALIIHTDLIHLRRDMANYILPFVLVWFPVFIWLYPCLKRLWLWGGKYNGTVIYALVAGISIIIPTMLMQDFVESLYNPLIHVATPHDIPSTARARFFAPARYYVDTAAAGTYVQFHNGGTKYAKVLAIDLVVAAPLISAPGDKDGRFWVVVTYQTSVSRAAPEAEVARAVAKLYAEAHEHFPLDATHFAYLDLLYGRQAPERVLLAIKNTALPLASETWVLCPVQEDFEARAAANPWYVGSAMAFSSFLFFAMASIPRLRD